MHKLHRNIKRRYKKIACALAGAACLSAALIHGVPAGFPAPATKPLAQETPPAATIPAPADIAAPSERATPQETPAAETSRIPEKPTAPAEVAKPPAESSERVAAPQTTPAAAETSRTSEKAAAETERAVPPATTDRRDISSPETAKLPAERPAPEAGAERTIEMVATAYAPGPHDNDQWGNKTYLGTEVRPGVIAVDPRVIPLGSRVMIKYPDGHKEYAVAEDTGGAIKGRRIDVAKWTVAEANRFGIKAVKVYVLGTPAKTNQPRV